MDNYLDKINIIISQYAIIGVRVCFELAVWSSSDGLIKTYYHVHIQHDLLPDLNIGIGDNSFEALLIKVDRQIIPELKNKLNVENSKIQGL